MQTLHIKWIGSESGMASKRMPPHVRDHPILLTDLQVEQIMALVSCYEMLGKQHSSELRREWGQVAYTVVHDVLEIVGIRIPRTDFVERM